MGWKLVAGLLCAGACFAQRYEIGASIGYGTYRNGSVISPGGTATAGIRNRFVAGAVIGEDMYNHLSGEVRYLYHDGDPFISAGNVKGNIQGQSHAIHYDMLFHALGREERIRPYAAAGVGAKFFETTGPAPVPQPLPQIAELVGRNEWRVLVTVGGGVKVRAGNHVLLRADFRDYITPFPTRLFRAAGKGTVRGVLHQFTPVFGVSYYF